MRRNVATRRIGIMDGMIPNVVLFPNPATNAVTLKLDQNPVNAGVFALYDLGGKMILRQPVINHSHSIDISALPKGIYQWKLLFENAYNNGKLVVN
jgi:hypothetical protein